MARAGLKRNIASSGLNVLVVIGASLIAVPFLIDRLGLAAYGVWTLVQTIVFYITTAELGFGPALARFAGLHATDPHRPRQILMGALTLYIGVGLAVVLLCHLLADTFVRVFPVPPELAADTAATVRLIGWVALAALVASALGHVLSGLERFDAFTWSNVLGSAAFLAALAVLMREDARMQDAAYATLIQWGLVAVIRIVMLRRIVLSRGPRSPGRALVRDLFRFSMKLQGAVLATLLNTQTDRVVIGAVAPATTLGQAGVATQVADAGRFLGYAAFAPVMSRMAVTFGAGGTEALDPLLARQRRLWVVGVLGAIAVGVGAVRPAIEIWLGDGYGEAALFAALLIAAYGIGLLPNPQFGYLRAVGRPGLEGVYGVVTVVVNLVATLVLGILAGALGVVIATVVAYSSSTAWVLLRARRSVPASTDAPIAVVRLCVGMALAGAAVYGVGEGLLAVASRPVALLGLAVAVPGAIVVYMMALAGFDPASAVRGLRAARRGRA